MRIGHGFDLHAFQEGEAQQAHVMIAGVAVPHERGVKAHSDGDVAIHALCDALLGALALGDIGQHFPDTDPRYHQKDSAYFLEHCMVLVREQGYVIANLDITVLAELPKIKPFTAAMRARLAPLCGVEVGQISIKATTLETMDAIGQKRALAAHAVVLLQEG